MRKPSNDCPRSGPVLQTWLSHCSQNFIQWTGTSAGHFDCRLRSPSGGRERNYDEVPYKLQSALEQRLRGHLRHRRTDLVQEPKMHHADGRPYPASCSSAHWIARYFPFATQVSAGRSACGTALPVRDAGLCPIDRMSYSCCAAAAAPRRSRLKQPAATPTRPLVAVASGVRRRLIVTGARSRYNRLRRDHRRTIHPRATSSPPDRCAH